MTPERVSRADKLLALPGLLHSGIVQGRVLKQGTRITLNRPCSELKKPPRSGAFESLRLGVFLSLKAVPEREAQTRGPKEFTNMIFLALLNISVAEKQQLLGFLTNPSFFYAPYITLRGLSANPTPGGERKRDPPLLCQGP